MLRSNDIETVCHQNNLSVTLNTKHRPTCKVYLKNNGNIHIKKRYCKNNMASVKSKIESVLFRIPKFQELQPHVVELVVLQRTEN